MVVWWCGGEAVRRCGAVVCVCLCVWLFVCDGQCLGVMVVGLSDCRVVGLLGCLVVWLFGCVVVWLSV